MHDSVQPDPIRSPALEELARHGVKHGFFTRAGGVSVGIYRGLNAGVGSQDAQANVRRIAPASPDGWAWRRSG